MQPGACQMSGVASALHGTLSHLLHWSPSLSDLCDHRRNSGFCTCHWWSSCGDGQGLAISLGDIVVNVLRILYSSLAVIWVSLKNTSKFCTCDPILNVGTREVTLSCSVAYSCEVLARTTPTPKKVWFVYSKFWFHILKYRCSVTNQLRLGNELT